MNARTQLVALADQYCTLTGSGRGTVSAIILNRGSALAEIAAGKRGMTTDKFEAAIVWFSKNWPDDVDWPSSIIARPVHPTTPSPAREDDASSATTCPVPSAPSAAPEAVR